MFSKMANFEWHMCEFKVEKQGTGLRRPGNALNVFSCDQAALRTFQFVCLSVRPTVRPSVTPFYTPVFRRDVLWYGAVRPSVRSSVRPTVSTKKHRCKWWIFFKFCTQVCLGVPSINLLFVLSYLIKYAHNSIISDFSIFGIHRVIF